MNEEIIKAMNEHQRQISEMIGLPTESHIFGIPYDENTSDGPSTQENPQSVEGAVGGTVGIVVEDYERTFREPVECTCALDKDVNSFVETYYYEPYYDSDEPIGVSPPVRSPVDAAASITVIEDKSDSAAEMQLRGILKSSSVSPRKVSAETESNEDENVLTVKKRVTFAEEDMIHDREDYGYKAPRLIPVSRMRRHSVRFATRQVIRACNRLEKLFSNMDATMRDDENIDLHLEVMFGLEITDPKDVEDDDEQEDNLQSSTAENAQETENDFQNNDMEDYENGQEIDILSESAYITEQLRWLYEHSDSEDSFNGWIDLGDIELRNVLEFRQSEDEESIIREYALNADFSIRYSLVASERNIHLKSYATKAVIQAIVLPFNRLSLMSKSGRFSHMFACETLRLVDDYFSFVLCNSSLLYRPTFKLRGTTMYFRLSAGENLAFMGRLMGLCFIDRFTEICEVGETMCSIPVLEKFIFYFAQSLMVGTFNWLRVALFFACCGQLSIHCGQNRRMEYVTVISHTMITSIILCMSSRVQLHGGWHVFMEYCRKRMPNV